MPKPEAEVRLQPGESPETKAAELNAENTPQDDAAEAPKRGRGRPATHGRYAGQSRTRVRASVNKQPAKAELVHTKTPEEIERETQELLTIIGPLVCAGYGWLLRLIFPSLFSEAPATMEEAETLVRAALPVFRKHAPEGASKWREELTLLLVLFAPIIDRYKRAAEKAAKENAEEPARIDRGSDGERENGTGESAASTE